MRNLKAELARKEKALAEAAALLVLKKNGRDLGGRGRRQGRDERLMIIELLDEAVAAGARYFKACQAIGLAPTTVARWKASPDADDARRGPITKPSNALTAAEEHEAIAMMNAPEHSSMSPWHRGVRRKRDETKPRRQTARFAVSAKPRAASRPQSSRLR